jgi:hypothetical protein
MEKIPFDQLADTLNAVRAKIEPGSKWQHYKGNEYIVKDIVLIEATNEVAVLYTPVLHPSIPWVRTYASWIETVVWNESEVLRFTRLA